MFDNMHHVGIYFISPIGLCNGNAIQKDDDDCTHEHRKRDVSRCIVSQHLKYMFGSRYRKEYQIWK